LSVGLAPRPANEEQRVKAVVKTGLIEAPNPELFQVYCDLAKDITGYGNATFSLYDGEMKCEMALTEGGHPDPTRKVGDKNPRTEHNICAYVLLDPEPLIMPDISKDPIWKDHPNASPSGYAGFPVINKDNFALGTLCMFNLEGPKELSNHQIDLVKKIASNIAHLLDIQIQQKEMTSQKFLEALIQFRKVNEALSIDDFQAFVSLSADLKLEMNVAKGLIDAKLCDFDDKGAVVISAKGIELQRMMKIETKPMKKIKMSGDDASSLIDQMFSELE
tara:strand:+ start:786 stop:1613 length:828 start_codon:yes stop_codon:yes gene_type:complete